ncbi:MAG: HTH domain-containing protein [Clostridiales bacterium]|nr:HTH domain-containing protein [Clostridiales bacterium]
MKDYYIFGILLYLIKKRRTTATEIGREFNMSSRNVYRYIDTLSLLGIPITTKVGKGGGIELLGDVILENMVLPKHEKDILKDFVQTNNLPTNVRNILFKLI